MAIADEAAEAPLQYSVCALRPFPGRASRERFGHRSHIVARGEPLSIDHPFVSGAAREGSFFVRPASFFASYCGDKCAAAGVISRVSASDV